MDDLDWITVEWLPRSVLHGSVDARAERGIVYFGRPIVAPLDADDLPEHLRAYRREGTALRRLMLRLNVAPKSGEPVTYVTINAVVDPPGCEAEFLEILPARLGRTVARKSKIGVSADLGSLHSEAEAESSYEAQDDLVVARGAGVDSAQWELREAVGRALDGVYELFGTIELRCGSRAEAMLSAAAGIRRKRLGVIGYTAQLPSDIATIRLC